MGFTNYDATQFEQMVARIKAILQPKTNVTWNEKIRDPDTGQLRQIDITIREGESVTIVECRLHKAKQNVKWIEEMIGRRESLHADAAIAVSASGFTKPALKKAAVKGIYTRDIEELTEEEVAKWGKTSELSIRYVNFSEAIFGLQLDPAIQYRPTPHEWADTFFGVAESVSKELINTLSANGIKHIRCGGKAEKKHSEAFDLERWSLEANLQKVTHRFETVGVFAYGLPGETSLNRIAHVQEFSENASIERVRQNVTLIVDLNNIPKNRNAVYCGLEVSFHGLEKELDIPVHLCFIGVPPRSEFDFSKRYLR